MKLEYLPSQQRYVFRCSYTESDAPRAVGFRWDPDSRHWYTPDPVIASRLRQFATPSAAEWLMLDFKALEAKVITSTSHAPLGKYSLPCPDGLEYFPFQAAGAEFIIDNDRCFVGDEPGLGKTVQAIAAINYWYQSGSPKILVITRASLKLNWAYELRRWLTNKNLSVQVVTEPKRFSRLFTNIWVVAYSQLDSLTKLKIMPDYFDCTVWDEAHAVKNQQSLQGKAAYKLKSQRLIQLSGTPAPNHPHEIYPLWRYAQPDKVMPYPAFKANFIGFKNKPMNTEQMQLLLKSSGYLIRRFKADVYSELPPKMRRVIVLPSDKLPHLAQFDSHHQVDSVEDYHKLVSRFSEAEKIKRKELGVRKIPYVVKYMEEALEESPKIILFAHHLEVIDGLMNELRHYSPVKFDGRESPADKDKAVRKFQHDENTRIFIGGITAAKEGLTLTAASRVVFAELDYVPGVVTQAEDRAHRIGQKDQVLVEHLVFENSSDCRIVRIMIGKQYELDKAFNWRQ